MKLIVLTFADNFDNSGFLKLKESVKDFEFLPVYQPFGFGIQYKQMANFVNSYQGDATHFVYVDAYDNICFGTPDEVEQKFKAFNCRMLISAEKNCFPSHWRSVEYPKCNTPWKYINGGGSMFEIEYFKEMVARNPMQTYGFMDPDYLLDCLLKEPDIKLDNNCEIFQTIAHSNRDEWDIVGNRIRNIGTNTTPVFFHGNGRTNMDWIYETYTTHRNT